MLVFIKCRERKYLTILINPNKYLEKYRDIRINLKT